MSKPAGRKAIPFGRSVDRTGVDRFNHWLVSAVAGVRIDVGDQATVLGPPAVSPVWRLAVDDQDATSFAVDDEFADLEGVSFTERSRLIDRDVCSGATDSTDTVASSRRWQPSCGGLDSDASTVFASRAANGSIGAGTLLMAGVDDVGAAIGVDDRAAIPKRTEPHRFGSGTFSSLSGSSGCQR